MWEEKKEVVFWMTLSQLNTPDCILSTDKLIMKRESDRAYFKAQSKNFPTRTEENHKLPQDRSSGRDSSPLPPKTKQD
jgi:hypothetical protein